MQIRAHKQYDKAWAKLPHKQQVQALAALKLLSTGKNAEKLRLHQLKGRYYPQYSLSAGGDLRIHFLKMDETTIVLMAIGTHSQLYG